MNVLLNLIQSAPVGLNPYLLTLQAGALGPFNVSVGVAQASPLGSLCPCQPHNWQTDGETSQV